MSVESLSRGLRERAAAEGFDACAIAAADLLERDEERLSAWLTQGRHAEMHWMARDPSMRADPRKLLEGCRSVIVLAMNYWPGEQAVRPPASHGRG